MGRQCSPVSPGPGWVSAEGLVKRWKLFLAVGTSPKLCRDFMGSGPPFWVLTCGLGDFLVLQCPFLLGTKRQSDVTSKTQGFIMSWLSRTATLENSRTVGCGGGWGVEVSVVCSLA